MSGQRPPVTPAPVHAGFAQRHPRLLLAAADLWHDRRTTVVLVLTVAAIIAPLLLLFGLKTGVINSLRADLRKDPRTLEIVVVGAQPLPRHLLDKLARHPDAAFVLPRTRSINTTMDLVDDRRLTYEAQDLIPTAAGDPLLAAAPMVGAAVPPVPATGAEVLLTETLATAIGVAPGAALTGLVRRSRDGRPEQAQFRLRVIGIIPEQVVAQKAVFTHPDLLIASEDYRDGRRADITDADLAQAQGVSREQFASARIYARDLDGVARLAAAMREAGVEIRTQAEKIASVQAIDRVLGFIFLVIAIIGIGGCALALGGALWINVERKRRDLALLRLFGYGPGTVVLLPLLQSLAIAGLGFALALCAYLAGAAAFNAELGANLPGRGYVSQLAPMQLLGASGVTLLIALIAATAAGHRASRIDPAECLRGG